MRSIFEMYILVREILRDCQIKTSVDISPPNGGVGGAQPPHYLRPSPPFGGAGTPIWGFDFRQNRGFRGNSKLLRLEVVGKCEKTSFFGRRLRRAEKKVFFIDFRSKSGFWHPHFSPPSGQIGPPPFSDEIKNTAGDFALHSLDDRFGESSITFAHVEK